MDHFGKALDPDEVLQWSYARVAGFNTADNDSRARHIRGSLL